MFAHILRQTKSPRMQGHRPHAIVDRPTFFTPRIDPRLGAPSQHQELHRCALWRIFRPALRNSGLTRILHHLYTSYTNYIIKQRVSQ